MKQALLSIIWLLGSTPLFADQVRVYCKPEEVVIEKHSDGTPFKEEEKLFDVPSFIIEDSSIPPHQYGEQLKCEGTRLIVDESVVTPRIQRDRALTRAKSEYDTELANTVPDTIRVLRIQRDIELIRRGNEEKIREYFDN